MNALPDDHRLHVAAFSRAFENTTNSYKFYWLLSILDHLARTDEPDISYEDLSMNMLSLVWYPLDYYKLSFGSADSFKKLAETVSLHLAIDNGVNAKSLLAQMRSRLPDQMHGRLCREITLTLRQYVACRFIRPFFSNELKGTKDQQVNNKIIDLANSTDGQTQVPYTFEKDGIRLNNKWAEYFKQHQVILRGFTNWHLLKFLQKHNPNVIGLSEKLEKPGMRDMNLARKYWTSYLKSQSINCIYSKQLIHAEKFSLDHFIPWSYMAHDQVWNIIPTSASVNSSKSNILPSLNSYLEEFCQLQYNAFHFHLNLGHHKIIEDYSQLLAHVDYRNMPKEHFIEKLKQEMNNNSRIAGNMGFQTPYVYGGEGIKS